MNEYCGSCASVPKYTSSDAVSLFLLRQGIVIVNRRIILRGIIEISSTAVDVSKYYAWLTSFSSRNRPVLMLLSGFLTLTNGKGGSNSESCDRGISEICVRASDVSVLQCHR